MPARRLLVDPASSSITVTTRPTLDGTRVRLAPPTGELVAADPDLDEPTRWHGRLHTEIFELVVPEPLASGAAGLVEAVGHDPEVGVAVAVTAGREPDAAPEASLDVRVAGRRVVLRTEVRRLPGSPDPDAVDVAGRCLCDPRSLGLGLPPLITFAIEVRWRLRLVEPERSS